MGQIKRTLSREEAEAFYAEHKGKPFFERLISFMTSGDDTRRVRSEVGVKVRRL